LLTCDGVSELVQGHSPLFLTELEDRIEVLDPAETELVPDDSSTNNAAILHLESQRRRSVANDEKVRPTISIGPRVAGGMKCGRTQR
jgi:hypothetical protein